MIRAFVLRWITPGVAMLAFVLLSRRMGVWPTCGAWLAIWAGVCGLAAYLLSTAELGVVNWRNSFAGMVLCWGYSFSNGKLVRMALGAWGGWALLGLALAFTLNPGRSPGGVATSGEGPGVWAGLLFLGWMLDGVAFFYLLGVLVKNFRLVSREGRQLLTLMAVLLALVGGSGWLAANGFPRAAALLAAGPLTVFGGGYALFLGVMAFAGRNSRWN